VAIRAKKSQAVHRVLAQPSHRRTVQPAQALRMQLPVGARRHLRPRQQQRAVEATRHLRPRQQQRAVEATRHHRPKQRRQQHQAVEATRHYRPKQPRQQHQTMVLIMPQSQQRRLQEVGARLHLWQRHRQQAPCRRTLRVSTGGHSQ
jgi:hypothetical protein